MQIIGPPGPLRLPAVSGSSYRYSGRSALYGLGAFGEDRTAIVPPKTYGGMAPPEGFLRSGPKSGKRIGRKYSLIDIYSAIEAVATKHFNPAGYRKDRWLDLVEAAYGARSPNTGIASIDTMPRGALNALRDDIAINAGPAVAAVDKDNAVGLIKERARKGKDNFGEDLKSKQNQALFEIMTNRRAYKDDVVKVILEAVIQGRGLGLAELSAPATPELVQRSAAGIIWGAMQRFGVVPTQQMMDRILAGQKIYAVAADLSKPAGGSATATTKPPVDTSFATGTGVDSFVGGGQAAAETKPAQQMPGSGNVVAPTGGGLTEEQLRAQASAAAAATAARAKAEEEARKKAEAQAAAMKAAAEAQAAAEAKRQADLKAAQDQTVAAQAAAEAARREADDARRRLAEAMATAAAQVAMANAAAASAAAVTSQAAAVGVRPEAAPATAVTPTGDIVVADGGILSPPPPAPKSNTALIVGGVALAAVIGGVLWARSRRA